MSDLAAIYSALCAARDNNRSLASWVRNVNAMDSVRSDEYIINEGFAAYERLARDLRNGAKHIDAPDDYKPPTSCQCGAPNAAPPCSWCCDPDNDPDKESQQ